LGGSSFFVSAAVQIAVVLSPSNSLNKFSSPTKSSKKLSSFSSAMIKHTSLVKSSGASALSLFKAFCIFTLFFTMKTNIMIPGSKGQKSDVSLLARGFLTLGPAKNMKK
jgi:hypothetical protein